MNLSRLLICVIQKITYDEENVLAKGQEKFKEER